MASFQRTTGFQQYLEATEDYLGMGAGFRAAVIEAIKNMDSRMDDIERRMEEKTGARASTPGASDD